jgi:hypothetical protein
MKKRATRCPASPAAVLRRSSAMQNNCHRAPLHRSRCPADWCQDEDIVSSLTEARLMVALPLAAGRGGCLDLVIEGWRVHPGLGDSVIWQEEKPVIVINPDPGHASYRSLEYCDSCEEAMVWACAEDEESSKDE